jgi:3-hydroxyacyl-[acyl-carrier-protein] dehydratase
MLRKLALLTALTAASAFTNTLPTTTPRSLSSLSAEDEASSSMGAEAISALTKDVKTVFSLEDIAKILPHRYPFLLVDKVVEYEEGKVSLCICVL